jgi:hypothetical protein
MKPVKIGLFAIFLSACSTLSAFDNYNQSEFLSPMPDFTAEEREELFGDYFRLQDDNPTEMAEEQVDQLAFVPFIPDFTPEEYEELLNGNF